MWGGWLLDSSENWLYFIKSLCSTSYTWFGCTFKPIRGLIFTKIFQMGVKLCLSSSKNWKVCASQELQNFCPPPQAGYASSPSVWEVCHIWRWTAKSAKAQTPSKTYLWGKARHECHDGPAVHLAYTPNASPLVMCHLNTSRPETELVTLS